MNSILDKVKIYEAGTLFIVSGKDEATVNYVMRELKSDGARNVGVASRVGNNWIATFEHPLLQACEADRQGYRITVTGPTKDIVLLYSEQFKERGAIIETGPLEEGDNRWVLYLIDDAARTNTTFFT
jgi:hypothetical protein